MADFDNLFDAAIARADETIRGYMGTSATMTSGEQSGAVIRGVFDDPENISYAGQGVRVEGSSPSLFVRTDEVRQLRRGDTLTIGEENFWVDRVYCGDGELLHHIPEQLSKRERYTDKWQRRTHSLWRHRAWHASAFTGICNDLAAASTFV
ncbi:phage head-tail adaptor protein [Escherichia coli]|nr:phage head-tail adaptor protein [Escherichia coli]